MDIAQKTLVYFRVSNKDTPINTKHTPKANTAFDTKTNRKNVFIIPAIKKQTVRLVL